MINDSGIIRTGIGYDVHRFKKGRELILGGVKIDYEYGLDGHSDADVICHAIADSLLGAAGQRDIGYYFPPSDGSIEGISSLKILEKVSDVLFKNSYVVGNIDVMLISESPRISPYIDDMKKNISESLKIEPSQIGIKATSNELMGFVGRKEGMAAISNSLIFKKEKKGNEF